MVRQSSSLDVLGYDGGIPPVDWTVRISGELATEVGVGKELGGMYQGYLSMLDRAGLGKCVALAVASTAAWYLLQKLSELVVDGSSDAIPADWDEFPGWLLLWFTGTVYSVLVLFRYLDPGNLPWRPVLIGFAGALSYWIGVQYVLVLSPSESVILNAAAAGVITAAFVGYLVIRLGTLRLARGPFAALCMAGALGGATIGWAGLDNEPAFVAGHAAWQVLTCVALFYSPRSAPPAAVRWAPD